MYQKELYTDMLNRIEKLETKVEQQGRIIDVLRKYLLQGKVSEYDNT